MTYIPESAICTKCNRILPGVPGVAEAMVEEGRSAENSPDAFCRCDIAGKGEKPKALSRREAGWRPGWGTSEI